MRTEVTGESVRNRLEDQDEFSRCFEMKMTDAQLVEDGKDVNYYAIWEMSVSESIW